MTSTTYNATKVFVAGVVVGAFVLEGFSWLTRDARAPFCLIPFPPASVTYCCTADAQAAPQQRCKCTECGMKPAASTDSAKTER